MNKEHTPKKTIDPYVHDAKCSLFKYPKQIVSRQGDPKQCGGAKGYETSGGDDNDGDTHTHT